MKRRIERLLLVVLIVSLILSTLIYASGSYTANTQDTASVAAPQQIKENVYKLDLDESFYLLSEEMADGSIRTSLFRQGGYIVNTSYLDVRNHTITETNYTSTGQAVTEVFTLSAPSTILSGDTVSPMRSSTSRNMGRIDYEYMSGNTSGHCSVFVVRNTDYNTSGTYNLRGKYGNISTLCNFIAQCLVISVDPAMVIARQVFLFVGAAFDLIDVIVPDHYVSVATTENTWILHRTKYTSLGQATIIGTSYMITETGYSNYTFEQGEYYPAYYFTNHNNTFAIDVYNRLYAFSPFSIIRWNDA